MYELFHFLSFIIMVIGLLCVTTSILRALWIKRNDNITSTSLTLFLDGLKLLALGGILEVLLVIASNL